jgi:ABC-2 type transport system permease protein
MNLSDMFLHEWRTRLARPAALASLAAFAAILIYAAIGGRIERDARASAIAAHEDQGIDAMERWLADLQALETRGAQSGVSPWSASPMDLEFPSSLPPAALADFAIGQADLLPSAGKLSLWDPDVRLFSRYELEDPVSLALGALDLSKAVVLLLPLLMIVLAFDILSAERDAGRLRLTLAQGADLRRLFWQRLGIRCAIVVAATMTVAAAAFAFNAASPLSARLPAFIVWCACSVAYGTFWFATIGYVSSNNRSGESNIVRLLLCWAGFTLIVPAAVTAIAEAIYPSPSRLAYLAQARRIEIETERREGVVASGFFIDHPELVVDDASEMPAYLRTAFFVTSTVDNATRPVLAEFERTTASRDEALALLRYVSPAIIAHGVFNEVAGASSARHHSYMAQAREFKAAYAKQAGPFIAAGRRMPSHRVKTLPRFRFNDVTIGAVVAGALPALTFLAFATGALVLAADRRLRSIEPASRARPSAHA